MMIRDSYLYGRCTLVIDGVAHESVHCHLDLSEQRIVCDISFGDALSSIGRAIDQKYEIRSLELWGPDNRLSADRVSIAFAGNVSGGGWSIDHTPLRHQLGLRPKIGRLSLVINEALDFSVETSADEIMFKPGFDTAGPIELEGGLNLIGGKDSISIIGPTLDELKNLTLALSLAIGCPCRPVARQQGNRLTVHLNNFGAQGVARPLFYRGHPFSVVELVRSGIKSIFEKTRDHVGLLPQKEAAAFRNSVTTFLQVRSIASSYELQLYGAFHFLEWFDDSRSISANILVSRLGISRKEADVINNVRNALAHNNLDLAEVVEAEAAVLFSEKTASPYRFRGRNSYVGFLNYLFSTLGRCLLERIGYMGEADSYFPVQRIEADNEQK